jgi:prevent-host-death family protein
MMQVNILEAKNRLSQLIKSARAGEDVVIANRGEPVARLIPADPPALMDSERGEAQAILDWLDAHPLPAHARRPVEEIDTGITEERAAWD